VNAYSEDLRKKIVEALRRGATKSVAARTFGVSRWSVKRYAKPKPRPFFMPLFTQVRGTGILGSSSKSHREFIVGC
jgi:hypothetical protein